MPRTPLKFEPGSKYRVHQCRHQHGRPHHRSGQRHALRGVRGPAAVRAAGHEGHHLLADQEQLQRLAKTYKPNADKSGLEAVPASRLVDPRTGRKPMPFPAGGLFSTATDVSLFCRMILNGGILNGRGYLSEKAIREMTSTQTGRLPVAYGYGWFTDRQMGGPFGHGGA